MADEITKESPDIEKLSIEEMIAVLKTDVDKTDLVANRLLKLREEMEKRNDDLSKAIGDLKSNGRSDDNRIDDLIELRDKINDGFDVLLEHEEYEIKNKNRASLITANILKTLQRAEDFLDESCKQFSSRPEDTFDAEHDEIRFLIRFVDSTLGEGHVKYLEAYLSIDG